MDRNGFIRSSAALGGRIMAWLDGSRPWPELDDAVSQGARDNVFFTPYMQRRALGALAEGMLQEDVLRRWTDRYPEPDPASGKKVCGIVAAGNIPAVAFHDILTVLAAGWHPVVKLSSRDSRLLPVLFPEVEYCSTTEGWRVDALMTMGGDEAAEFYRKSFEGIPQAIRSGRFSAAVLTGREGGKELEGLAEDMLLYYGMGCRSATCLLVPEGYDFSEAMAAAENFARARLGKTGTDNHRKNRAVLTLAGERFLDSGTVIFRDLRRTVPGGTEDIGACRPWGISLHIGEVWYAEYSSSTEIEKFIMANKNRIQKIIRNFGSAQKPAPNDWPDGVDTLELLFHS